MARPSDSANDPNRTLLRKSDDRFRKTIPDSLETQTTGAGGSHGERPVCDMRAAQTRVGEDSIMLLAMVGFFFEDSPELLQRIRRAAAAGDAEELARAAHSLKGLCANFDAADAVQAALAVEKLGRESNLSAAPEAIRTLEAEVRRLHDELDRWQAENS